MHQITLTVSQNVLMHRIIQMNNNFTACVQNGCHQHAHMISDGCITGQLQPRERSVHSQTKFAPKVFAGHQCHKSLFCTRIAE